MTQVLVADAALVIHTADEVNPAKILHAGEFIKVEDLVSYQQEAALAGTIPYSRVMELDVAEAIAAEMARVNSVPGQEDEVFELPPVLRETPVANGNDVTQEL